MYPKKERDVKLRNVEVGRRGGSVARRVRAVATVEMGSEGRRRPRTLTMATF